jgi:hypothetical protein
MKYYLGTQFVPNKGEAHMFYEVDDNEVVLRTITYITGTGEITKISDPIVKKLIRKEVLSEVAEADFTEHWNKDA